MILLFILQEDIKYLVPHPNFYNSFLYISLRLQFTSGIYFFLLQN